MTSRTSVNRDLGMGNGRPGCRIHLLFLISVLAASCTAPSTSQDGPRIDADAGPSALDARAQLERQAEPPPPLPGGSCPDESMAVLHQAAWPGGGIGLTLRLEGDQPGEPELVLETDQGDELSPAIRQRSMDRSYILVLVDLSGDSASADLLRAAAGSLVDHLPPSASLALYRRCTMAEQVVGFSTDRRRARALLREPGLWDGGMAGCLAGPRQGPWQALAAAVGEVALVGGQAEPALRSVVFLGERLHGAPPEPLSATGEVDVYALVQERWEPGTGPGDRLQVIPWTGGDFLPAAAELGRLMADRSRGIFSLGACPGETALLHLRRGGSSGRACELEAPTCPPGEAELACDAGVIAAGERRYPRLVQLLMDDEQRAVFERCSAEWDRSDFELRVKLGGAAPARATAHLRGQSSIGCQRKSFTVNLEGRAPRHILPGVATDRFLLISMCLDDRYFQQYTANLLAAGMGLFPMGFGFVELRLDGETRGVYLMLEKPDEALEKEQARPELIVRRRFDPDGSPPDVHLPAGASLADPELEPYRQLLGLSAAHSGESLVQALEERIDLEGYLRLVALQSLLGNGDWVDEVFFSAHQAATGGKISVRHRGTTWDMDDLFSDCHHEGRHAMSDPHGLLYCAEGDLEKGILSDPSVHGRYVDVLEELIVERLTEERLAEALGRTAEDLLGFFDNPEVCAAMVELVESNPAAIEPAVAIQDIRSHMEELVGQYRLRREELLAGIARYRAGGGR